MNNRTITRRRCFTLIELLVVVAIIAVLVAILLPALGEARRQAMRTQCQARLHQTALVVRLYADDHQDRVWLTPTYASWHGWPYYIPSMAWILEPYLDGDWKDHLHCPAAAGKPGGNAADGLDYGGSCSSEDFGQPPAGHRKPFKLIDYAHRAIVSDRFWSWGSSVANHWHETGINVLWGDGGVRWFDDRSRALLDLVNRPDSGYYYVTVAFDQISGGGP
ncbi:MAG: prepilin-type N-terminal cleavage/methylation domain-containing protein [Phycisphaerae bacterium]|nr:prepilin-type N-terminal cleavage/methylation domain-containing protein [Phycisphaerae bacterium]